jgi:hypothetical protein
MPDLCFDTRIDPDDILLNYRYFTRPHPRYRIIGNKTMGAALIDLERFPGPAAYLEAIQGKNHGGWHARRARARGYVCTPIERNDHVDDIHAINTALDLRQGRPMDAAYLRKAGSYERQQHCDYYGVLNEAGKLVAYGNIGALWQFQRLYPAHRLAQQRRHHAPAGGRHRVRLLERRQVRYVMYDTFFGARPGLQQFKRILGFEPYRVKYSLQ